MKRIYQRGFTLIELLVVIAVLAILAAAVVTAINPLSKINAAKDSTVKSDLSQLANALQSYYTTQGQTTTPNYPATLDVLTTSNELKSLPKQQAGYAACPAAPTGSTLASGAGTTAGYYCYYITPATGAVTSVAILGTLFGPSTTSYHCWDSTSGAFKSPPSTGAPTIASGNLSCQ